MSDLSLNEVKINESYLAIKKMVALFSQSNILPEFLYEGTGNNNYANALNATVSKIDKCQKNILALLVSVETGLKSAIDEVNSADKTLSAEVNKINKG